MIDSKETLVPFSAEWKRKGCVCEIDTDGIIVDKEPDVEYANKFLNNIIKEKMGITNSTLELEPEYFERGFLHRMKTYILLEKERKTGELKVILHGQTFKSTRAPKVYDDAIQCIVDYAIWDKLTDQEARKKAMDIEGRSIEDFVIRVKMNKKISDYKASSQSLVIDESLQTEGFNPISAEGSYKDAFSMKSSQIVALAMEQGKNTGTIPEKGDILSYIIAWNPLTGRKYYEWYNPKDDDMIKRVSIREYRRLIEDLFNSTEIAPFEQTRREDTTWLSDMLED